MPQFDFTTFSVQIFWVLITFFLFYFTNMKNHLSQLSLLFKIRFKVLLAYVSTQLKGKKVVILSNNPFLKVLC